MAKASRRIVFAVLAAELAIVEFPLRFPGQVFDRETGTAQNYFRDYDAATGRYVQADPIGLAGGLNTYAYGLSNPLAYSDPSGLDAQVLIGGPYGGNSYGHVALRVFGPGYDYTYDYGRYGQTWGIGGSQGEGQLRVWTDSGRYIAGENATGRTTTGYTYSTTPEQDRAVIDYYSRLTSSVTPNRSRGSYMNQYRIGDYEAVSRS